MWVEFGNDNAVEAYRDANSDDPDLVQYRPIEGQQVTSITFPEGTSLQEAFTTAVEKVNHHFAFANEQDGIRHKPAWIDSDSEGLKALLTENFGLKAGHARPKTWGNKALAENAHLPSAAARTAAPATETQED